MRAILKKIDVPSHNGFWPVHQMLMYFVKSEESDELYRYKTSVEQQFCTKEEFDIKVGLSDELLEKKIEFGRSLVGLEFEVNLYKFMVKDLTNNKYVGIRFSSYFFDIEPEVVEEYRIATYMTQEDALINLKQSIAMRLINGVVEGILSDGSIENVTKEILFPEPPPERKYFDIPYDKFPDINSDSIMNEISTSVISNGYYLATQLKEGKISEYEFDNNVKKIENYRIKICEAKKANESLRKKVFFWEPKETVEELKLYQDFITIAKDCIILYRLYPRECEEARNAHMKEIKKRILKELGEDEQEFREQMIEERKALLKKYKGKEVLRPIDKQ